MADKIRLLHALSETGLKEIAVGSGPAAYEGGFSPWSKHITSLDAAGIPAGDKPAAAWNFERWPTTAS